MQCMMQTIFFSLFSGIGIARHCLSKNALFQRNCRRLFSSLDLNVDSKTGESVCWLHGRTGVTLMMYLHIESLIRAYSHYMVTHFWHHLSDNDVDLSDFYVVLSALC